MDSHVLTTLEITDRKQMLRYATQVWRLMRRAYAKVAGGWHYDRVAALLDDSARWCLALYQGRVVAATICKAKRGLKLVAMAACDRAVDISRAALQTMIRADLGRCWMEVSEAAERFVMRRCGGECFVMHGSLAAQLLERPLETAENGYHYYREICGLRKRKLLVGTPVWQA